MSGNRHFRSDIPVRRVETFYRDELYLDALIEKVDKALSRFPAFEPSRNPFQCA